MTIDETEKRLCDVALTNGDKLPLYEGIMIKEFSRAALLGMIFEIAEYGRRTDEHHQQTVSFMSAMMERRRKSW